MSEEIPDPIVLDCGCHIDCDVIEGKRTMIHTACSLGEQCEYVQFSIEQGRAIGNEVTVLDTGMVVAQQPEE